MIRIKFCDTHQGFEPYDNVIVNILSRNSIDWEYSENPDFLFFSGTATEHYKYDNCVKVFITGEPVAADFNICDYAIAFPYMEYGDRYIKRPAWFGHVPPTPVDELGLSEEALLNRKFCNFVYSNSSRGTAVAFRQEFAKELMKYKHIDCPGRVLNNMPEGAISPRKGHERPGKIEFVKDYKFTIAFENCQLPGYTTEKMEDPLIAHSVPIYWGDPYVGRLFNTDSFICVNGRENDFQSVIDEIIYYDTHDDEYLKLIRSNPVIGSYEDDMKAVEDFVVSIIKNGKNIYTRDPLGFGRVMTVPDYRAKDLVKMLGDKVVNKLTGR